MSTPFTEFVTYFKTLSCATGYTTVVGTRSELASSNQIILTDYDGIPHVTLPWETIFIQIMYQNTNLKTLQDNIWSCYTTLRAVKNYSLTTYKMHAIFPKQLPYDLGYLELGTEKIYRKVFNIWIPFT